MNRIRASTVEHVQISSMDTRARAQTDTQAETANDVRIHEEHLTVCLSKSMFCLIPIFVSFVRILDPCLHSSTVNGTIATATVQVDLTTVTH